jgi:thioredoxin-like negative regulator of GroEL
MSAAPSLVPPALPPPTLPPPAPAGALPPGTVPIPLTELLTVAREYMDAGRYDAADRLLGHSLAANPRHGETIHLKGFNAFKRNRIEEAAVLMEQALAAGATQPRQLCNLAEVYRLLGRLDEGLAMTRRAQALAPTDAVTHFNESMLRYERQETEDCIRACRRAIQLKGDMPEAHMRLGQTLLLTGRMEEGWEEYEWRYQIQGAQPLMPKIDKPQWDGAPLGDGQTLLLVADQGFGDVIMFARYLPWAFARAKSVAVATSVELAGLLERHYPGPTYFSRWDLMPQHVAYCPFSGLARLHKTRLEAIPAPLPYLRPLPEKVAEWRERLDALLPPGRKRVAIAWAGRPTHNNDRNRSVTLDMFAPFGHIPGLAFVAVQKGPQAAQAADWRGPAPLVSLDAQIESFDDTMGILENVDILVCVDTSLGHLAGAANRPAWIMMPYAPDWRWLREREDSPWYSSLRLFRQDAPKAWAGVIERIGRELAALAAG